MDIIYHHPQGNGRIFVGNDRAASNLSILQKNKITHIVNCTRPARGGTLANYFSNNSRYKYYEFPVACWQDYVMEDDSGLPIRDDNKKMLQLMKFLKPMFMFLRRAVLQGNNVLVHCLAGAHRAGTTGILTLMYFMKLNAEEAQKLATSIRPIINPISDFPDLLKLYEKCQKYKIDRDEAGTKRERNASYSLSSLKDLSGSQLHLSGGDPRPKLNKSMSVDQQVDQAATANQMAAMLSKKSHSAIEESLNLGKNASKELSNPDWNPRKKSDSRRRRSLDSEMTATIVGTGANSGSSWLKFQQRNAKESAGLPPIVKEEKNVKKSRRSYDPESSLLSSKVKQQQRRRGSLGALPNISV